MDAEQQAKIDLANQVENFLGSDVSRLLLGRAERDEQSAIEELLSIDPHKYTTLSELQNHLSTILRDVRTARTIGAYLHETLIDGENEEEYE